MGDLISIIPADMRPTRRWQKNAMKYPFHEMEIGESFAIPQEKTQTVRNCALRCRPKQFSIYRATDGNYYCTRTA